MDQYTQARILSICAEIEAKGLQLSSGLVKSKVGMRIPLPQIIAGIQAYQQGARAKPEDVIQKPQSDAKTTGDLASQVAQQAQVIAGLQRDINTLKALVAQLQADLQN
jgi:hypothetical protein